MAKKIVRICSFQLNMHAVSGSPLAVFSNESFEQKILRVRLIYMQRMKN